MKVNSTSLLDRLNNKSLLRSAGFVAGEWVASAANGKTFDITNPSTNEVITQLPDMSVNEAKTAIKAAYIAQKEWAARTGKERSAVMRKWHDLMVAQADDLGAILTAEMGKPLAEAKGEILYGASFIEWFGEEAKRVYGDVIPGHQRDKRIVVLKQPVGVVAAITPWNFPNAMIARKVAPALAVGCAFIVKPAKQTPLSALAMAVLGEEAGIPKGLLSVITSASSAAIGEEFCSNEKVRKITFTGSTEVGKILMKQSADQVMKASMELGGNAPFIVFDDADIDAAVAGAIAGKYRNAGQTCVCVNRFMVQEGVYDAFITKFAEQVALLQVGNGMDDGVSQGPMINQAAIDKVKGHIADALSKGGELICGGESHPLGGTFFTPTIIGNASTDMKIASEETFGPLAPIFKFKEEEQAIAMANDTEFGLAAYFYTRDIGRVWRVGEALEYGIVGINEGIISTEVAPFGGVKQSGIGREGSHYGIEDFLEIKYMLMGGL